MGVLSHVAGVVSLGAEGVSMGTLVWDGTQTSGTATLGTVQVITQDCSELFVRNVYAKIRVVSFPDIIQHVCHYSLHMVLWSEVGFRSGNGT